MKNTVFVCQIEAITPLHVGNGQLYRRGIDFDVQNNKLLFYNTGKIHARLSEAGAQTIKRYETELLSEKPSVTNFLKSVGWKNHEFLKYQIPVYSKHIRDVRKQVKTGLSAPIIPGSSLKGALRTAMLSDYFDEHPEQKESMFRLRNPDKQKADKRIIEAIFGKDPNYDLMRQVSIGDVEFSENSLNLFEMKIANLTHNGYGFLNMFKRRNEHPDNWKFATSIVAEAIKADAQSKPFTLAFDGFLEEHHDKIFGQKQLPLKEKFLGAVHYHFKILARKEYEFFAENDMDKTAKFYENQILNREFGNDEVLIRVGWGGGWKFMTGDWLTDEQLQQVRRQYRLGRKEHPIFPKSRRLIIQDQFPQIPLGWAILNLKERID